MLTTDDFPGETENGVFTPHPTIVPIIKEHGGRIVYFKDLPIQHQLALIWYMSVDGAAWAVEDFHDWEWGEGISREYEDAALLDVQQFRPRFVACYGNERFGMVDIPTPVLCQAVMQGHDISQDFDCFEEYKKWYANHGDTPDHKYDERWPVILGSFHDETLDDGWHRFHCYCNQNADIIPAVWYPHVRISNLPVH